ncbi:N-glycosyltransferase [Pseudonocardia eucalypti]|uniref:nucleotide disphospho-sugar-binding domain-containing protein n=1 Tax=Pseudonocardia eucalypti TaxID=648755 RepID=UPI00160EDF2A|nr:N-glycosyltransferase [Pseudonocardia eucalypti]
MCTVWSVRSHLVPLLPALRALLTGGADVLVVTTPALAGEVAATGARAVPMLRDPEGASDGPDYGSPLSNALAAVQAAAGLRRRADELIELAREFRPDVVIRDDTEFAGYLAAERLGLPLVCLAGAMSNALDPAAISVVIDDYRRDLGLPALADPGGLYPGPVLDYLPEELSVAVHPPKRALRFRQPQWDEPDSALPESVAAAPAGRPVVFAAIGTAWRTWREQPGGSRHGSGAQLGARRKHGGRPGESPEDAVRTLLDALSRVDCAALVSTGGMDCAGMPRADHVTVRDLVPQRLVLQASALFCTHGGYNSIREAVRAGVPMLVRPSTMDQPSNAEAVARLGLGSVTLGLGADELADRIRQALADTELAERAAWARRRTLALPPVETLPDVLHSELLPA